MCTFFRIVWHHFVFGFMIWVSKFLIWFRNWFSSRSRFKFSSVQVLVCISWVLFWGLILLREVPWVFCRQIDKIGEPSTRQFTFSTLYSIWGPCLVFGFNLSHWRRISSISSFCTISWPEIPLKWIPWGFFPFRTTWCKCSGTLRNVLLVRPI